MSTPPAVLARVHQPGCTHLSVTGGALVARGLGRCWVREAQGRWSVHPDAPLATVRWDPAARVLHTDSPLVPCADYVVGPTPTGRRALAVVRAGEQALRHPSGAMAVGDEVVRRCGAPGRTVRAPPWPLRFDTVRFADDGRRIVGVDVDGVPRGWSWLDGATWCPSGWPVGPDHWLDPDGALVGPNGREELGLVEASVARNGPLLAGPGARVWDLRTGRAVTAPHTVHLGLTVPWGDGFATIHWASHEGATLLTTPCRFRLPLDDDDLVTHGRADGDTLLLGTALGAGWAVSREGVVHALPRCPPDPGAESSVTVSSPWGRLTVDGYATVAGRTYAWSSDGFLLDWISSPSTSGYS